MEGYTFISYLNYSMPPTLNIVNYYYLCMNDETQSEYLDVAEVSLHVSTTPQALLV